MALYYTLGLGWVFAVLALALLYRAGKRYREALRLALTSQEPLIERVRLLELGQGVLLEDPMHPLHRRIRDLEVALASERAQRSGFLPNTRDLAILGLEHGATWDDIQAAYRILALVHHPDRASSNGVEAVEHASRSFKLVDAAFSRLSEEYRP